MREVGSRSQDAAGHTARQLTRVVGFLIIQAGYAKVSFCEETNMLKPIAMTEGHYECRSLDETLPIFTDLLALEVVERKDREAVVKHPNTVWRLVVHEGGPDAPKKPPNHQY